MFKEKAFQAVFLALLVSCILFAGCGKSGEVEPTPAPFSYVGPTIANLSVTSSQLSVSSGGILSISCKWACPASVATASGFLAFVRSVKDAVSEPTGVIASETASGTLIAGAISESGVRNDSLLEMRFNGLEAVSPDVAASDSTAFFARFKDPIVIPTGIGTNLLEGLWQVDLPFTVADIHDAPIGKQQMLLWMTINGYKTNSLAFEIEFVE